MQLLPAQARPQAGVAQRGCTRIYPSLAPSFPLKFDVYHSPELRPPQSIYTGICHHKRAGHMQKADWRGAVIFCLAASFSLTGCAFVGPRALKADQVEYARALGGAKKREILALAVGLRYADLPGFLNVSQIIAGYSFDVGATANANSGGAGMGASGTLAYADHPTFTFTPMTGDYFARAYIHPFAPAVILPLANSGVPVDLLLRIGVQSVGRLQNATMLGGPTGTGSPEFFELLHALRRLQLAGELSIHYKGTNSEGVILTFGVSQYPAAAVAADIALVRTLLDLPAGTRDFNVVSGTGPNGPGQIVMVTRSVLSILTDLGGEIGVPDADVRNGSTKPAIGLVGGETRPIIVVHATPKAPKDAYVAVGYRTNQFWIDDADFDSKYALTVVQDLMALAEVTDTSHTPVVTVPAN